MKTTQSFSESCMLRSTMEVTCTDVMHDVKETPSFLRLNEATLAATLAA